MPALEQFSVFDLFDDAEPAPKPVPPPVAAAPIPIVVEVSAGELAAGRLMQLRPNFVKLGWSLGGETHTKTLFSAQTSQVPHTEESWRQKTVYVVPVYLPEDWLKDPSQHFKALELEKELLAEKGFSITRKPGKADDWTVIDEALAAPWKVEACLCPKCKWMADDCKCQVQIGETHGN